MRVTVKLMPYTQVEASTTDEGKGTIYLEAESLLLDSDDSAYLIGPQDRGLSIMDMSHVVRRVSAQVNQRVKDQQ